jgi:hypothetical protein
VGLAYGLAITVPMMLMSPAAPLAGAFVGVIVGLVYGLGAGLFVGGAVGVLSWSEQREWLQRLVGGTVGGLSVALVGHTVVTVVDGHLAGADLHGLLLMLVPSVIAVGVGLWAMPILVRGEAPSLGGRGSVDEDLEQQDQDAE